MTQTKIDIEKYLKEFICKIKKDEKELSRWSYLALTGKFENQFRDYFAFYLQGELGRRFWIGRDLGEEKSSRLAEKKGAAARADIAIVKKRKERKAFDGVVELKAWYLFNANIISRGGGKGGSGLERKFVPELYDDLSERWKKVKNKFGVMLITDIPYQIVPKALDKLPCVTKYLGFMESDLRAHEEMTKKDEREEWRKNSLLNIPDALKANGLKVLKDFEIPLKFNDLEYWLRIYLVELEK